MELNVFCIQLLLYLRLCPWSRPGMKWVKGRAILMSAGRRGLVADAESFNLPFAQIKQRQISKQARPIEEGLWFKVLTSVKFILTLWIKHTEFRISWLLYILYLNDFKIFYSLVGSPGKKGCKKIKMALAHCVVNLGFFFFDGSCIECTQMPSIGKKELKVFFNLTLHRQ